MSGIKYVVEWRGVAGNGTWRKVRGEARYEADLRAEPDTREVAEDWMRRGGAESDTDGMEACA